MEIPLNHATHPRKVQVNLIGCDLQNPLSLGIREADALSQGWSEHAERILCCVDHPLKSVIADTDEVLRYVFAWGLHYGSYYHVPGVGGFISN